MKHIKIITMMPLDKPESFYWSIPDGRDEKGMVKYRKVYAFLSKAAVTDMGGIKADG